MRAPARVPRTASAARAGRPRLQADHHRCAATRPRRRAGWSCRPRGSRRDTVTAPSAVASAPVRKTVIRSRSVKGKVPALAGQRLAGPPASPRARRRSRSDSSASSGGPSAETTPTQTACSSRPSSRQLAQAAEGVEVGAVVAGVDRGAHVALGDQRGHRGVLAAAAVGAQLEHLAAPARFEAGATGVGRDLAGAQLGGLLVLGAAPVQRLDRPLVLDPQSRRRARRRREPARKSAAAPVASLQRGVEARRRPRRAAAARGRGCPRRRSRRSRPACGPRRRGARRRSRPARSGRPAQRARSRAPSGTRGLLGPLDDRRQGPVDVGEDRRRGRGRRAAAPAAASGSSPRGPGARDLVSPSLPCGRILKLAAIGTAAGAFSGLFGVGGGTVIVPLLIVWLAYGERLATGTSLAAIVLIAGFAAVGQGGSTATSTRRPGCSSRDPGRRRGRRRHGARSSASRSGRSRWCSRCCSSSSRWS